MRRLLFSFFAGCIVTIVVWERIAISKWMAHQYAGVMETRRSTDAVEDVVKTYTEGIHVLTSFYMDTNVKRRNEIWSSITNNIAHKFVKKVHLMFEGGDAAQLPPLKENLKEKLVVVPVDAQPTYKRFFEYANRVLLRGTIAVVLNADIYIGEGFGCLRPPARNSSWDNGNGKIRRVAFALSRWPEKSCRRDALKCAPSNYETFTGHHGSHDAFVFAPPLPPGGTQWHRSRSKSIWRRKCGRI